MNKKQAKILIITPTYEGKDYCLKEWSNAISELTYPNLDILLIDNSKDEKHLQILKKHRYREKSFFFNYCPENENIKDIRYLMASCNEFGRFFALKNGYTHIFSIESDVFPPTKDCVERLLSFNKLVVGYDYFVSQKERSIPVISYNVEKHHILENLTQRPLKSGLFLHNGELRIVDNLGLGCLLIGYPVFSTIKFLINDKEWLVDTDNFAHADTFFHVELRKRNINIWCDTSCICRHDNQSWANVNR